MLTMDEQLAESQLFVRCYRADRDKAEAEVDRLEATNADLVEALKKVSASLDAVRYSGALIASGAWQISVEQRLDKAVAVVAKAEAKPCE